MRTLNKEIIEAAIAGFEAKKQNIDAQIAELRAMLVGAPAVPGDEPKAGKAKRKFSPAAKRKMRDALKRRWARVRSESTAPAKVVPKTSKPK